MSKHALTFSSDFKDLSPSAWIQAMTELGDEHGYFAHLGDRHMVTFLDAGPNLLVTFEDADDVRLRSADGAPFGFRFVRHEGWSHLAILSAGPSWFREEQVIRHFDRLTDDGFFDDFDQVLFMGDGAAGYAAAAYSVASPGANVFLTRPQATQDPRRVSFDRRFLSQRRVDFNSRYGYAPDMIDAANKVFLAFDPMQRIDAIHASLYVRDNVTPLRCIGFGETVSDTLQSMDVRDDMMRAAMDGALNEKLFYKMNRARRGQTAYRRNIVNLAKKRGHPRLAATICANQLRKTGFDPFYAKHLKELEKAGFAPFGSALESAAE